MQFLSEDFERVKSFTDSRKSDAAKLSSPKPKVWKYAERANVFVLQE